MPSFPKILKVRLSTYDALHTILTRDKQVLYSKDVLSDQAIIYWHGKGSKAEGRAQSLKAAEPLVTFLKEQEEEEEDESDEE